MRSKFLSRCILREHFTRHALQPVVIKQERWHLPVSLSYYYSSTITSVHRFFSSTIIDACDAVENLSVNLETSGAPKSSELDQNRLLFQNADLSHLNVNWESLLQNCAFHLASLTDEQLEILLQNIFSLGSKLNDDQLLKFTFAIDQEFIKRAPSWTMEQSLVYFELYSDLPRLKKGDFIHHLLKLKQHKIFRHDIPVVIKFVRLMNKGNFWVLYHVPKYDYEIYLCNNLTKLSISDFEVFLDFMVKVRQVLNTPGLFQQFCQLVLEKLPELSSVGITNFCKILYLRRAIGFDTVFTDSIVEELLQSMTKCENLSANSFIEAASLCMKKSLIVDKFYSKFSFEFNQQMSDLPLRQLAAGMNWLTHFDEKSEHSAVYDCLVKNLRAKSFEQVTQHPMDFIMTMYYLSRVGVYPVDLLDILFSTEFIARAYPKGLTQFPLRKHYVLGQELLTIDGGVGIECTDYKGNRLDANVRHNIQRYYCWNLPKLLSTNLECVNFEKLVKSSRATTRTLYITRLALERVLGGARFVHTGYLLPHLPRPNLLFATSKEGTPVPLTSSVYEKMIVDRSSIDRDLEWFTFGVYSFGGQASENEEGGLQAEEIPKVRQLKKMGFNVLRLVHREWFNKNEAEIEQCLRNTIDSHVESKIKM